MLSTLVGFLITATGEPSSFFSSASSLSLSFGYLCDCSIASDVSVKVLKSCSAASGEVLFRSVWIISTAKLKLKKYCEQMIKILNATY